MKKLELLPAIDVKGGKAVRLVQGELAAESQYGNPLEVAQEFAQAGAELELFGFAMFREMVLSFPV